MDDLGGAVGGAVVDDDPVLAVGRLGEQRLEGRSDAVGVIVDRYD
jgi:hypothetical protein